MALPQAFLDELRARTPLASLVGRRTRLEKSGRNWKACCPFHNEKTPSFYIYDDGFHCFGCGAHGDAISFVMRTQNSDFREAVQALAAEAGLEVPKPSPEAAAAERRRHDLHSVLEAAAAAFRRRLRAPEGAAGLAYLRGRGVSEAMLEEFGLGWSGDGRGGLVAELGSAGIAPELMLQAGLLRAQDSGPPRELFYRRVMFPIHDRRGRVISFGGRLLGEGQPKYVNGPETDIFAKRDSLYGLHLARAGLLQGGELLVVEGYLDVISLHQAGLRGAVAPLGTALTEAQLAEAWRLSPAPILCFDGDAAGRAAARRAAETALPHLAGERMLKFLSLPAGEDPDSFIRTQGPAQMQRLVAEAPGLSDVLYGMLRDVTGDRTPEQRAALRNRLTEAAARIQDRSLASEYRRVLLDRFFAERPGRAGRRPTPPPPRARPVPELLATRTERARNLTAILLHHPVLLTEVEDAYGRLSLPAPLDRLRDEILHWAAGAEVLDSAALIAHLTHSGLAAEVAQALSAIPLPACAMPDALPAEAEAGWWHVFGLMDPGELEEEVAAARTALAETFDARAQERLIRLCIARDALRRGDSHALQPEHLQARDARAAGP